jgi:hypothetical protein
MHGDGGTEKAFPERRHKKSQQGKNGQRYAVIVMP